MQSLVYGTPMSIKEPTPRERFAALKAQAKIAKAAKPAEPKIVVLDPHAGRRLWI